MARGHVRKVGKTWAAVIYIGVHPEKGYPRYKWVRGLPTRKAAQAEAARLINDKNKGRDPFPENITLRAYLDAHWLPDKAASVKGRTLHRYQELLDGHVLPTLGELELRKIRPAHVRGVLGAMRDAGLAPSTVVQCRAVLGSVLRHAVDGELLEVNPVTAVKRPKIERPKLTVLTAEHLGALMTAAAGTVWEVPVLLAATTGMRRAEVLAVRWSVVDLDRARLSVTASLQRVGEPGASELTFVAPKTDQARRQIDLPAFAAERVRRHRAEQAERRLAVGPAWSDLDLVCDRGDGGPLDPDAFTKAFGRLARQAGLPAGARLHDVRHGVATMLLERGVHPAIASAVLGHASPAFTMSVYQHLLPGMTGIAAEAIGQALGDP